MSCCNRRRRVEPISEEIESTRCVSEESEAESCYDSFHESKCFMVIWRDRCGRRRYKCCYRDSE
jgi:hypothetical protein